MKYEPHSYQKLAIDFICDNPISALLLDMGLGKTSITLSAIDRLMFDEFQISKVLIIAPLRVAKKTWSEEIEKWDHLKNLKYSIVVGSVDERIKALRKRANIYIINRENVDWLVSNYGANLNFDMLVLDELSSFKNGKSKRFKALLRLRPKVKRVVGLTGTPASNGLMDLWAEYRVLDLGIRLGKFITHYRDKYFIPDKRNAQQIFSYKPLDGAEEEIYKQISDITISMKSRDFLQMPDLLKNTVFVEMSQAERKMYDSLKQDLVISLDGKDIVASNAAALSMKLMQMANGAVYDENQNVINIHDKKLDALEDLIESACGKPVLVAYNFKHDLERIKNRLDSLKISYDEIKTVESIENWNAGKLEVGLIHPRSAGHGLNLQKGGSTIIWFGLDWSLENYEQTNGRLYRQGQNDKSVVIEHIVTKGSIDEAILEALKNKDVTQAKLIESVKAQIGA